MKNKSKKEKFKIEYVPIESLIPAEYNARKWPEESRKNLRDSINKFDVLEPLIANCAPNRKNVLIGGNFRHEILKELGYKEVPVVFVNISDIEKEKELNLRLNRNTGEWDWDLLEKFDEKFLENIGFNSEELDNIFYVEDTPEQFDLQKELKKLNIEQIDTNKGDIYQIGPNFRLMNGDSTIESDFLKLMNGEKADMCMTDWPYFLDYLHGKQKKGGKATTGFGLKRDRRYLETESLHPDDMGKWMANVHKIAKEDFSIISFENWKNLPMMWQEMAKYWKIRNLIIWHTPNRVQGFAVRHKFFNKYDIALLGSTGRVNLNLEGEGDLLDNEFETALYATSGKPHFENYEKGKKICPTDFVSFKTADEKSSGQAIIFGVKPIEILIPYIKILTKRGDLVVEPFGGSGSTGVAAIRLGRLCYMMEKSSVYIEVIKQRMEKIIGIKAEKIHGE